MIVYINADWRVRSNENNWICERRFVIDKPDSPNHGRIDWRPQAFFRTAVKAVTWCATRQVALIDGEYGPDAVEVLGKVLFQIADNHKAALARIPTIWPASVERRFAEAVNGAAR